MSTKNELLDWLRHYAENFFNPLLADERRCLPPYILMDLGNKGFFGLNLPKEYSGQGLNLQDYYQILSQLGAVDLSLATVIGLHSEFGCHMLYKYGSETVKKALLPRLATGQLIGAMALTEPAFGTNFFEMKTTGIHDNGNWILNGVKRWNPSNWANVITIFALCKGKTAAERGVTGFTLLKETSGVIIGQEALTMGFRSIMQNAIFLKDVTLTDEYVLGEPFRGFDVIDQVLFNGRISGAYAILGTSKRALQLVYRFLTRRKSLPGKLIDNQFILDKLNQAIAAINSIQALADDTAENLTKGIEVSSVIPMILKVVASEYGIKITKMCMQLAGGRGYMENNHLPRLLRDVLASYYGEGANDALLSIIGSEITYKTGFTSYLETHYPVDDLYVEFKKMLPPLKNDLEKSRQLSSYLLPNIAKVALFIGLYYGAKKRGMQTEWAEKMAKRLISRFNNEIAAKRIVCDPHEIEVEIAKIRDSIGDIEFLMKGEETSRDAYLKKAV